MILKPPAETISGLLINRARTSRDMNVPRGGAG